MKLQAIDISRVLAVKTDDWSVDQVTMSAFVACGPCVDRGGHSPGTFVPVFTPPGETHHSTTLNVPEGVPVAPPTTWGRIFPTTHDHRQCCQGEAEGQCVSGRVFFFDSDTGDWSFKRIFGVVLIALVSLGVTVAVAAALSAIPLLGIFAGAAAGLVTGAVLAKLWERFLDATAGAEYLGGIRVTFPCENGSATIEETHDLIGASNGIDSDHPSGVQPKRWGPSSAEYKVTFTARYG